MVHQMDVQWLKWPFLKRGVQNCCFRPREDDLSISDVHFKVNLCFLGVDLWQENTYHLTKSFTNWAVQPQQRHIVSVPFTFYI